MSKRPSVCFIGLDGSGKSTSIEYAYEYLKQNNEDVKIVRAAYVIKILTLPIKLGKKLLLKESNDPYGGDYKGYLEKMRAQTQSGFVYKVFSMLTTLEFKAQIFFNVKLQQFFGKFLLIDRYIYDNAVTYAANLGLGEEYIREVIEKKWKNSPKPDLIIYIKTPVEVCCSRKDDIPDPLYLEVREPLYDLVAEMYNAKIISGKDDKEKMFEEVKQAIEALR